MINMKSVIAIGNFDGMHIGHQEIIKTTVISAKERYAKPIVITFNQHPISIIKNPAHKYLMSNEEKESIMRCLGIGQVCFLDFQAIKHMTPLEFIHTILIGHYNMISIIAGHDFKFGKDRAGDAEFIANSAMKLGFNYQKIQLVKVDNIAASSTKIKYFLSMGLVGLVACLMGRKYALTMKVSSTITRRTISGMDMAIIDVMHNTACAMPMLGIYSVCLNGAITAVLSLEVKNSSIYCAAKALDTLDFIHNPVLDDNGIVNSVVNSTSITSHSTCTSKQCPAGSLLYNIRVEFQELIYPLREHSDTTLIDIIKWFPFTCR